MKNNSVRLILLTVLILLPSMVYSWSSDTSINTPIVVAPEDQFLYVMVPDGAGGAFIVWQDERNENETDWDLYSQHIDFTGAVQWNENGIVICDAPYSQMTPVIIPDGSGGMFVAWLDKRENDDGQIYVSHITDQGAAQWGANGVVVTPTPNNTVNGASKPYLDIISDGDGGVILLWVDVRSNSPEVYVQRLNSDGDKLWGETDKLITSSIDNGQPYITADGSGGAIISWNSVNSDVYAQKINGAGGFGWGNDGIVVYADSTTPAANRKIVSDGSGGAFLLFSSGVTGFVQHVSGVGAVQWVDPVIWSDQIGYSLHTFISDEQGGVVIAWDVHNSADPQDLNNRAIYVQMVAADGSLRLGGGGLHIGNKPYSGGEDKTSLVSDGSGGFIASWTIQDTSHNLGVYAQGFDRDGSPLWGPDPLKISTNPFLQQLPAGVTDGEGGAIFIWLDRRNGDQYDIYAHKLSGDGSSPGLQTPANLSPGDGLITDLPVTLRGSEFVDLQGIVGHATSQWRLNSLNTISPMSPEFDISGDDAYSTYQLPFSFPFYGRVITSISFNTNGLVELLEEGEESYLTDGYLTHSEGEHIGHVDAVFAANGDLDLTSGYLQLYNAGDHVVIEWFGATYEDAGDVNARPLRYQVTLFSDGRILWNFRTFRFYSHEGDLFSGLYPNSGTEIPLSVDIDYLRAHSPIAFEFDPVSRQIFSVTYNWFTPQPVLYDSGQTTDLLSHQVPSSVPLADHTPYYWGVRYKGDNNEWTLWSTPTGFVPDLSAPTIISTVPAGQGDNIAVNTIITVAFSEEMAAGSITDSISLSGPEGAVAGSVHYNSGFTSTFTPEHALTANTTYTATVTTAVTDMVGKHLASEYNWVFTTSGGADTTPPLIVSRTPAANAVDVAVDIAAITFSFSESLQESTIDDSSVILTGPGGRVTAALSYDAATYTVQLDPVSTLAYDAGYIVTVTTDIQDSVGNPLASRQTWGFTTADTPPPPPLDDTTAPLVVSYSPTLAASPVPAVAGVISATFNEVVRGVGRASFIVSHNSVPVSGTVDFDEGAMTARFYPDDDLEFDTTYSVRLIALSIYDLADNFMEHDTIWSFETGIDPALSGCNPELFQEDGCENFDYFTYGTGSEAGTYRAGISGFTGEDAARRSVSFEQPHSESLVDTDNISSEGEAEVTGSMFRLHITSKRKNDNSDDSGGWAIGASKIQVTGAPPGTMIPMSMVVSGSMPWGSMILQVRDMAHYQMLGAAEGGTTHMHYTNIVNPFAAYSADNYIHTERNSNNIRLDFQYPVEASNGIYVWFIGGTAQYRSTGTNLVDLTARLEVYPPPGVIVRLASGQVFTGPVDSDRDGVADAEDSFPDDGRRATPETPNDGETIAVDVSMNAGVCLSRVQVRDDDDVSLVQDNKPQGYIFPDGLVSFQINGLQPGATAIVALEFPTPFPPGARYFKVNDNGFHEFSGAVFSGNRVTLTIRDGGDGDSDGVANGVIVDPGGPAVSSSKKRFWTLMLPAILGPR